MFLSIQLTNSNKKNYAEAIEQRIKSNDLRVFFFYSLILWEFLLKEHFVAMFIDQHFLEENKKNNKNK